MLSGILNSKKAINVNIAVAYICGMTVKLTIKKDTPAARAFEEYMAGKEAFRKAAEEGKLQEYVETKPERFAAPLPALITK